MSASLLICFGIIFVYGLKSNNMGEMLIGAGILGGSSLLGTAATIATNKSNQNFGSAQSDKARQWSTNERLAVQQYNTSEREAAQQYNTSERLATQAYNDPRNQMKLMRASGLNLNALANGVSFVGANPQHIEGQSSSLGFSSTPAIGTAQVPNIPQLISSGSDLVNALSKNKATEASLPLINQQVEYYLKKTYGEQLTNDLLSLEKQLKQSTLPADIKRQFEEVAKLQFEKVVSQNLGKKYENEAALAKAQESLAKATEKLTGEQAIQAQFISSHQKQSFDSMMKLQKAQTNQAYTQAQSNTANARFANAQAFEKELSNEISKATQPYDIDNAIYNADVIQFLQQSSDKQELFQKLERQIKLSKAYKDHKIKVAADAAIENVRKILGINVGVSAHN